ncbi:Lrp/AsnC family transcriptional regulator [Sphingomonas sp. RP10(2022)]|uniref:Lrp/AsnC family transcriptional regulator n=1 Tax=Sphingomonas liriopis TaxID=2949094 RepID=A0A9X2HLI8_9SPHN|nr:Lrp/AsnC family transcriptional regulator [Sphingomonas liriopis]MCP3733426.1 Lrp/AsnC family transcriptional regulator [Sphingomonas liriopis]
MTSGNQPTRLLARAMGDLLMSSARVWARVHDGDVTTVFVFCTILSANLAYLGYDSPLAAAAAAGDDGGAALRRPISAHAIAESMSLPYETVRRRVVAMTATGMLVRERSGLVVPAEALRQPAAVAAMHEGRCLLEALRAVLVSIGFDLVALAGGVSPMRTRPFDALVSRIVLDAQIRSMEMVAPIFGDVMRAYIFYGVMRSNVAETLSDGDLAWRYAHEDTPPPDAARKPITIRELARAIEMPFETVRRQVKRLLDAGVLTTIGSAGVIAPLSVVVGEQAAQQNAKLGAEFFRMLTTLARVGAFLPADATS